MAFPEGHHRRHGKHRDGRPHGSGGHRAPHRPHPAHLSRPEPHPDAPMELEELLHPDSTGEEAAYLKALVDSHARVTVVLTDGERFRGHIRYYDQDCFSIGLSARGPRLFLRKEQVAYIAEDWAHPVNPDFSLT